MQLESNVIVFEFTAGDNITMTTPYVETGLIGGVEQREIRLVEYDRSWPDKFAAQSCVIAAALRATALQIEHIGSTSVPDLAAKPIIDILVVVTNSADEATYLPQLEQIGYQLRVREPDWWEHRMFRTPDRDVHVHVYSHDCPEIVRNLMFRDRLRSHRADRERYEQVKRKLTQQAWADMNAYAAAKTEVIESILAAAAGEAS